MGELKIRQLTVDDRDLLAALIEKLAGEMGTNSVLRLMVSGGEEKKSEEGDSGEVQYAQLVVEIIKLMIKYLATDIRAWFASLLCVAPEEFKKLPFDTELVILEQLVEVEKANRFFSRLLALRSSIQASGSALQNKKAA